MRGRWVTGGSHQHVESFTRNHQDLEFLLVQEQGAPDQPLYRVDLGGATGKRQMGPWQWKHKV